MRIFHYFKSQLSLGLDINSNAIRLLALRLKKGHIYIEGIMSMALPSGVVIQGKIQQPELISTYLKTMVQNTQMFNQRVTIALPMQSVISKKITSEEAVSINNVHCYFPGVSDVLAYDYMKIDNEILLMATRQDELMRYVALVEDAGLKVDIVDVDLYALARAVLFAVPSTAESYPIGLLEQNNLGSQFILFNRYNILYQQLILGSAEQIITQLKRMLETYFNHEEKIGLKKIYLLNDMPNAVDLIDYTHHQLFVETEQINFLADIPRHYKVKNVVSNQFLVCCGLALRGFRSC